MRDRNKKTQTEITDRPTDRKTDREIDKKPASNINRHTDTNT
jgi:hypothetical protein